MAGLLTPGPTLVQAEELRKRKGSRGLLEAVGEPMSYAPNPVVAALGQGLLGARYLTGEKSMNEGMASLSDMTAIAVGSRLPAPLRHIVAYHGGPKKVEEGRFGMYVTPDRGYAEKFAAQHPSGVVSKVELPDDAKIYPKALGWQEMRDMWRPDQMFKGYDAVKVIEPNGQGFSYFIVNPAAIR